MQETIFDVSCFTKTPYCDSCKVTASSNTIGVLLKVTQYVFQIKTSFRDTPSFKKWDWLKNKTENEVEIQFSLSISKSMDYDQ